MSRLNEVHHWKSTARVSRRLAFHALAAGRFREALLWWRSGRVADRRAKNVTRAWRELTRKPLSTFPRALP